MILSKCKRFLDGPSRSSRRTLSSFSGSGDPFKWDHDTDWMDYFKLDSLLTDEERMIRYELNIHERMTVVVQRINKSIRR